MLEGADGCGKSSQARALCSWLDERGRAPLHVREPGSTPVGEALRRLLLAPETGDLEPISEALLFFAARAELVRNVIAPAVTAGRVVIAERSYLSTVVYQGFAGDGSVGADWLFDLARQVHGDFLPDRIFVLDVDAEVGANRRSRRVADRIETRGDEFQKRVRDGFRAAAQQDPRVELIDANGSLEEVRATLFAQVQERIG